MKKIPTENEWRSEPWCLDVPYAYEHFFGKSQAEGQALFDSDYLCYQEDLMFMPAVCFEYYIHSFINHLLSTASQGDSDNASSFFGLVEVRHLEIAEFDEATVTKVCETIKHLGKSQQWYDADEGIYGNFSERAKQVLKLLLR